MKHLINPFSYYKEIIDSLQDTGIKISALCNFNKDKEIEIGLRHDIDSNPFSALRSSRYLARKGISGSFYVLITASYYGDIVNNVFYRDPSIEYLVYGLILTGCEIGIHNDVYGISGLDNINHLVNELKYLRSIGALIKGTTAHNTALSNNGIENFEVFRERKLTSNINTGVLSEKKLGLEYEGTFSKRKLQIIEDVFKFSKMELNIRNKEWMNTYLSDNPFYDKTHNVDVWLIGKDMWVLSCKNGFYWNIGLHEMIKILEDMSIGSKILMVLHPDYFEKEVYAQPDYIIKKYNVKKELPYSKIIRNMKRLKNMNHKSILRHLRALYASKSFYAVRWY